MLTSSPRIQSKIIYHWSPKLKMFSPPIRLWYLLMSSYFYWPNFLVVYRILVWDHSSLTSFPLIWLNFWLYHLVWMKFWDLEKLRAVYLWRRVSKFFQVSTSRWTLSHFFSFFLSVLLTDFHLSSGLKFSLVRKLGKIPKSVSSLSLLVPPSSFLFLLLLLHFTPYLFRIFSSS